MIGWPGRYSYNYYPDGSQREVRDGMGVLLRTYSYTPAGLLGRVDYPGQISPAFHYWDGDGNRVRYLPRDLPDIYTFVYDPTAGIPAVVEEINEDSGTTTLYYREPDGSLVARARYGVYQFYHFDALGSTRILTDGSGNVTDRYSYDAWGNVTPDPNNQTPDNPYQYVGELGYYTHYQEAEFDLLQLGVRFYDPAVGRFGQRDPAPIASWAVYAYALDTPLSLTDATGLDPTFIHCTRDQIRRLRLHLNDIRNNRIACITGGGALTQCIRRRTDNVVITCSSARTDPDCVDTCGYILNPKPRRGIVVCENAFNKAACGCLGRTLVHEMAHSCTPSSPIETPEGQQCEWDCYGKRGSRRCPD